MSDEALLTAATDQRPPVRRIGACVVTYNRREKLVQAVQALLDEGVDQLVVVDNGSTDGTREWLRNNDEPRLDVVESAANVGGAGGFELGMRHMMENHSTDWILLQDDDAWPTAGAIEAFRRLDLADDIGGVAAAVYTPDGSICEINRPGLNPFHGLVGIVRAVAGGRAALHVADDAYEAPSTEIDCASFVGLFVRTALVADGLGYPRGDFFIYSDDQLYSFQIKLAGFRIVFMPAIEFRHDTVSKSDAGYFTPVWKVYFLYRNNIEFYRAMAGRWFPLVMVFKLPAWALRVRHYPDRRAYLRMFRLGVADGLRRYFGRTLDEVRSRALQAPGR